jgi:hypothetical protein
VDYVEAAVVELWLNDALVITCEMCSEGKTPLYMSSHGGNGQSTHVFRAVCFEPIMRDTAEGLLREILALPNFHGVWSNNHEQVYDRARKLLGDK